MALNINKDTVYRGAKPKATDYSINDGGGLFLFVGKTGSRLWRFVYTFNGKRKKIAFGAYPSVTLEAARREAENARDKIASGKDPSDDRKATKSDNRQTIENKSRIDAGLPILNSFADIAGQWLKSVEHLTKPTTQYKKTSRLKRLAFPMLGDMAINQIKSSDILAVIKPIYDKKQLETAHRLYSEINSIFAYAIVHNFTDYDPAQPAAKQIPAQKPKHRAAIIDPVRWAITQGHKQL